jgi:hypothetical protein
MKNERTAEDIFLELAERCAELEWYTAFKDADSINGIITGTADYVQEILNDLPDGDEYEVYHHGSENSKELH